MADVTAIKASDAMPLDARKDAIRLRRFDWLLVSLPRTTAPSIANRKYVVAAPDRTYKSRERGFIAQLVGLRRYNFIAEYLLLASSCATKPNGYSNDGHRLDLHCTSI